MKLTVRSFWEIDPGIAKDCGGECECFGTRTHTLGHSKLAKRLCPDLTTLQIVGDGDCGETCASGANGVLEQLQHGLGADGDLVQLFRLLTGIIDGNCLFIQHHFWSWITAEYTLEACGGTLGAIFSIFLAGMTTSLINSASSNPTVTPKFLGEIALEGLEILKQRTAARVGHRTVMDAMIPFAESLASSGDLAKATEAARKGGEATATMQAKLGRATYVGERTDRDMPPDPGAMAFVAVVEGILKACK